MKPEADKRSIIALGRRLSPCPAVLSLGVRPNFFDYNEQERALILDAPKIYDPSAFYAQMFDALGKPTFPSYHTYEFAQDKIKQTALFQMAGIRHPRTRVFYGPRQKRKVNEFFNLPVVAKQPRGSARGEGVFLIRTMDALRRHFDQPGPAYIQEYLPIKRDIRVVVIGGKVVHAYWRIAPKDDFRTNLGGGGQVDFSSIPAEALDLALHTARCCQWDDVGIDICEYQDRYYVLEGNMKYGLKGFRAAGIDYHELLSTMISNGDV